MAQLANRADSWEVDEMSHTATQTNLPREELYALHASFRNVLYQLADPRIAKAVDPRRAVQADLQRRRPDSLGLVFEQE
jgi:hypothetical protein